MPTISSQELDKKAYILQLKSIYQEDVVVWQ